MKIAVIIEQSADGVWSASTPGVMAYASTRGEAIQGVRIGMVGLLAHVRAQGWQFPESSAELVSMEISA